MYYYLAFKILKTTDEAVLSRKASLTPEESGVGFFDILKLNMPEWHYMTGGTIFSMILGGLQVNISLCRWSPLSTLHNVSCSGKFEKNLVGLKGIRSSNLIRKLILGSAQKQPKRSHQVRIYRPTNNLKLVRFRPNT